MPFSARAPQAARPPRMAMFHPAIPAHAPDRNGRGQPMARLFRRVAPFGLRGNLDEECTDFCCGLTNSAECARMQARGLSPLFGAGGRGVVPWRSRGGQSLHAMVSVAFTGLEFRAWVVGGLQRFSLRISRATVL
jgi:hypothetical protein